jgi:hypothetical protein
MKNCTWIKGVDVFEQNAIDNLMIAMGILKKEI